MAGSKRKTTMAKLNRERKLLEKRAAKQAKKEARKRAAAEAAEAPIPGQPGSEEVEPSSDGIREEVPATPPETA
jgi:hypothetical protein